MLLFGSFFPCCLSVWLLFMIPRVAFTGYLMGCCGLLDAMYHYTSFSSVRCSIA